MKRINLLPGPPPKLSQRRPLGRPLAVVAWGAGLVWGGAAVIHVRALDAEIARKKETTARLQRERDAGANVRRGHAALFEQSQILERMSGGLPLEVAIGVLGRAFSESVVLTRLALKETNDAAKGVLASEASSQFDAQFEGMAVDSVALARLVQELAGEPLLRKVRLVESEVAKAPEGQSRRFVITATLVLAGRETAP